MSGTLGPPPRFSILLPTHNQRHLLALALRSALAQTLQDFEILVVADGCTDGSQDVVRGFADPRLRLFDLPKAPGFGYANRNVALREARGELIAFLAHDDLFLPDHLEIMDRMFLDAGARWAYSRPLFVESDGSMQPSTQNLCVPSHLRRFLDREDTVPAATVVYRRSCHEHSGFWDESLERAGDREFWSRLIREAGIAAIRYVPVPTALHFRAPWRHNLRRPGPITRDFKKPYPDAWPLAVDLGGNPVEQEVLLQCMLDDPAGWTAWLRLQTQAVLDGRLSAFDAVRIRKRGKRREKRKDDGGGPASGLRRRISSWLGKKA